MDYIHYFETQEWRLKLNTNYDRALFSLRFVAEQGFYKTIMF